MIEIAGEQAKGGFVEIGVDAQEGVTMQNQASAREMAAGHLVQRRNWLLF